MDDTAAIKSIINAAGRDIPLRVAGRTLRPYEGAFGRVPGGNNMPKRFRRSVKGRSKLLTGIEDAVRAVGLKDGMTVSFHHHLRYGDRMIDSVLETLDRMGFRNLRLATTALFPAQETVVDHIKSGLIDRIESSLNGPVGRYVSGEPLAEPVVLRTHGGRTRAIESGDLHIDATFIAASAADPMGNCNGSMGPSAFGTMGFAFADAWYADNVVVVTDSIVDYPCLPVSIQECYVDYVVKVDSIGDPGGISTGTLKITDNPARLGIARDVVRFIEKTGYLKEGVSFQAGAGGISLAVVKFLHERMNELGVTGSFAVGGTTKYVTDMLDDGTMKAIIDAQSFDLAAVESLRRNPNHIEVSHYHLMNPHTAGCVVHNMDLCFLGATEIDTDFNVNVNTHSDGLLLHGTGGHSDAAAGADICFIVAPLYRKKIPVIRDSVTTVTTPGETVDVIVTDHGMAVNPRRTDLLKKLEISGTDLPLKDIEELREMAYSMAAEPPVVEFSDREKDIVGIIEYRDGTVIDVVRKVRSVKYP